MLQADASHQNHTQESHTSGSIINTLLTAWTRTTEIKFYAVANHQIQFPESDRRSTNLTQIVVPKCYYRHLTDLIDYVGGQYQGSDPLHSPLRPPAPRHLAPSRQVKLRVSSPTRRLIFIRSFGYIEALVIRTELGRDDINQTSDALECVRFASRQTSAYPRPDEGQRRRGRGGFDPRPRALRKIHGGQQWTQDVASQYPCDVNKTRSLVDRPLRCMAFIYEAPGVLRVLQIHLTGTNARMGADARARAGGV